LFTLIYYLFTHVKISAYWSTIGLYIYSDIFQLDPMAQSTRQTEVALVLWVYKQVSAVLSLHNAYEKHIQYMRTMLLELNSK